MPRWILDRMAEMEASKRGASGQQPPFASTPLDPPPPPALAASGISFSASYAAASAGERRSGRALSAVVGAAHHHGPGEDDDMLHLSALSSSAGSILGGGGGDGGGRQQRVSALDFAADEDETAGIEVLEARLRGWMAERERFTAARAEAQLLQQQLEQQQQQQQPPPPLSSQPPLGASSRAWARQQARLAELRALLEQAFPTWREQTLPRIRRVHERIRRWKELEASASGASSFSLGRQQAYN